MTQPTGRNNDIVFGAEVDDRTIEFFNRFDANVERLAATSEQGFDKVEGAIRDVGPAIGVIGGLVAGLTTKMVEFAVQGLNAVKQFVQGSVQLTARADVLATVINKVGQQSGYSAEEIAAAEESVKSMGITTVAAREALVRMTRANIDWSEASKLARIAQDAAVVAGLNSSQAFERLVRGIQKQEPELLDELGINLRRTEAYKRLGAELGKTAKELTETERQQAILNEIYRQAGAVTGSYEAAMENVGKQATSLPRHIEELQLAIGRAFQPAYAAQIQFMTEQLKELREWFADNEEAVQQFSEVFGNFATLIFQMLARVIDLAKALPELVLDAGRASAKAIGILIGETEEELKKYEEKGYAERITTTALQAFGVFVALVASTTVYVIGYFEQIWEAFQALGQTILLTFQLLQATIEGDAAGMAEAINQLFNDSPIKQWDARATDAFAGLPKKAQAAAEQAMENWLNILGWGADQTEEITEDMADSIEDVGDAMDSVTDKARQFGETLFAAAQKMKEANIGNVLDIQRKQVEELLRLSHQIEDIERGHLETLKQIQAQYEAQHAALLARQEEERQDLSKEYADKRIKLEQDRAERIISIEQQFRDRIRDIQDNYEFDATEAGRNRDEVRLRQLMRQRNKEIKDAEKTRDRQKRDADKDYGKRLKDLDEWLEEEQDRLDKVHADERKELDDHLKEQIKAADEARKKQYEDLQRNLRREQQLRDVAYAFQNRERAQQFLQELTEHGIHLGLIEDITDMSLGNMLDLWDYYFQDLGTLIDEYIDMLEEQRDRIEDVGGRPSGGRGQEGRGGRPDRGPRTQEPQGVIGQGGQVSELLSSLGSGRNVVSTSNTYFNSYQAPVVSPAGQTERREIIVKGDVTGMDPHIQRVLVNTLTEIERNRVSTKGIVR